MLLSLFDTYEYAYAYKYTYTHVRTYIITDVHFGKLDIRNTNILFLNN